MAGGFKIAEGYLEIDADVDGALSDVRSFFDEIDKELDAEEKKFSDTGKKSGKALADGVGDGFKGKADDVFKKIADDALDDVTKHSNRRGGLLGALLGGGGGKKGGKKGLLGAILPSRGLLSSIFGPIKGGGKALFSGLGKLFSGGASLFSNIAKGIADAFSDGLDQAKQIWKKASDAFSKIGDFGSGVGSVATFAAYGVGVPLVLGLAGALTHLAAAALALPAALSVAVAAIAPLIVAFHGVGEAIGAGFSGDVDKFNEALKKLAPSARSVVKEIVALKPLLSQLRASVQQAFFAPLVGQLARAGAVVLPALSKGMTTVASSLGRIAAGFLQLLSAPDTINMLNNLFTTTARILDTIGPSALQFFGALFRLINAGLPWVERFNTVMANGLQHVADWINKAVAPGGKFNGWLERAWNVGVKLWNVIKELGKAAFTMLNAFGDEGTDTLRGLGDELAKINEFLKSDQGAETLHNLGVIIHWAGNAFVWFVGQLTTAWKGLNAFFDFVRGIGPFFVSVWDAIVTGVKAVGSWFAWLGRTIWGAIVTAAKAVGNFFVMIWHALVTAFDAVVGAFKTLWEWIKSLPGLIWEGIKALPGLMAQLGTMLYNGILYAIGWIAGVLVKFWTVDFPGWVRQAWDWVVQTTITGITNLGNWIASLPGLIWGAITEFGTIIINAVRDAWNWAVSYTEEGARRTWDRISALPGQIGSALSNLWDAIAGWFSRTWTAAVDATRKGVDDALTWIRGLPGRIQSALSGAGSWLVDVGRDMLRGLVDGIGDLLNWAVDAARNAAKKIADGFKHGLESHSPSQLMRREVGRWILPGIVQGMEDTQPKFDDYLGASANMIADAYRPVVNVGSPSVSVGGVTLIADLGEGIRKVVPVQILRHAETVATAANIGNRGRAAWTNTGRTVITGS